MIEKIYPVTHGKEKTIEKLIDDDVAAINHMILYKGDALPVHNANSNVYMLILRGTMTMTLDDQEDHSYDNTSIVNIPYNTKMHIRNLHDDALEFFVVKAPSPRLFED